MEGGVRVRLGLAAVAGLGWLYLVYMAWSMMHMDASVAKWLMPAMMNWSAGDLVLVWLMWAIMMMAMMLPSALPMVQMYRCVANKHAAQGGGSLISTFIGGYLTAWAGFSVAATLVQWGLLELRLVTPMMESASPWLSGILLLGAGAYQFSPFKDLCLNKCRTPLSFLLSAWRPGTHGAFLMGLHNGAYCFGCCAMLMLLLFVFGVMNLIWVAVLTLVVLVEKILPAEQLWPSRLLGIGLMVWGCYLLISA
jgi:predicted metal-binding membrane protein